MEKQGHLISKVEIGDQLVKLFFCPNQTGDENRPKEAGHTCNSTMEKATAVRVAGVEGYSGLHRDQGGRV